MPRHAQRQGFDTLQYLERVHRTHAGAKVAQALAAGAQEESHGTGFLGEIHAVKARIGLGERSKFARCLPVETAAIHQQAANGHAVTTEEFGRGMEHQVRAQIERLYEIRRGESGIDQQRQPVLVRHVRHGGDVQHLEARIAQSFAKQQPRVGPHGGAESFHIARIDEGRFDAEARQRVAQQVMGAAVQRPRGNDVRTGAHQRDDGQMQRRLAAGRGDSPHAAFQRRDALFQHRVGGIGDARIHMPRALHIEQRRCVFGAFEDEGSRVINRRGARAELAVGHLPRMQ